MIVHSGKLHSMQGRGGAPPPRISAEQEMAAYQRWEAALSPDPLRTRIADTDRLIRRMIKERRTGGEILEAVHDFFFDNAGCD